MPAEQVRSDWDQLQSISGQFNSAAETTKGMTQDLNSKLGELKGGKWVGKGANKFYNEMDSAVLPSLKRLENALNQASRVTGKIANALKQAEDECSSLFKGD